jgi:flavin-dependent dehydrogenase
MSSGYDVIVIGARCGGSPTAMLLAREGYRVLLVDKATFPSDTISPHMIHPPGVAALKRWGLLERLEATGCPPIARYSFDFGPITISGAPRPVYGVAEGFCPRRIVLDDLLVQAAVEAGAELREAETCAGSSANPSAPGLGARRRRRLPQGSDHRLRDHRRVPRRRRRFSSPRRRIRRTPRLRRRDGGNGNKPATRSRYRCTG